ncbi:MAG TPA: hypothetical protein VM869_00460 [Enhygromyxa sp.]|nr:hypothetical protein [Enhygromyxa sp.]
MSLAAVARADAAMRERLGVGLDAGVQAVIADELDRQFDRLIVTLREDRGEQTDRIETASGDGKAPGRSSAAMLTLAVSTAVLLVFAILAGALLSFRFADRLTTLDATQREKIAKVEARVIEAENRQLEIKAKLSDAEGKVASADTKLVDHERRVKLIEERQEALVVYLLESTGLLLKDRGIPEPFVPPILRISAAEAELRSK